MSIRRCTIGIALFVLAACNPSTPSPSTSAPTVTETTRPETTITAATTTASITPAATTEPVVVEQRQPKKPVERNITISTVEIANPLIISGTARTFENSVSLRARGADGTILAESHTTATGEMGQHSPYRGSLWLTREPGKRVVVEALEYSAKDGSETNLARVEKQFNVAPISAVLYFANEGCTGVKPFTRAIPKSVSMARLLMEALVQGPTAAERKRGAAVAFPQGAAVRSVNLRDGVLTVDFNERLQNVGGSCRAQMIRESVTSTLLKLPAVKKVVITAGGSEAAALQP